MAFKVYNPNPIMGCRVCTENTRYEAGLGSQASMDEAESEMHPLCRRLFKRVYAYQYIRKGLTGFIDALTFTRITLWTVPLMFGFDPYEYIKQEE